MGALIPLGDWEDEAACREAPTHIFFPEPGDPETSRWVAMFCGLCPVRAECLESALDRREKWGIWGGTTETERRALLRARHGARPNMARAARRRRSA